MVFETNDNDKWNIMTSTYLVDRMSCSKDNTYILLHGYFCIDLSMCSVNMYFPEGRSNNVLMYLLYDIIII